MKRTAAVVLGLGLVQAALAQFLPPGISTSCKSQSLTLERAMEDAEQLFIEENTNCINKCKQQPGSPCSVDCDVGIVALEEACNSNGGDVFSVAERIIYDTNGSPEAKTDMYICAPKVCNNANDIKMYEAWLQELYCTQIPGGFPVTRCFVDFTAWAEVSSSCEAATAAQVQSAVPAAAVAYAQANAACLAACDPRAGHSCHSQCLAGQDAYDKVCIAAEGNPVTYEMDMTLPNNNGDTAMQARTCVPKPCMNSNDLSSYTERLSASLCDEYSATEVLSCSVTLLLYDAGAVAGAVIGTFLGLGLLGFAFYHVSTRTGWIPEERWPPSLASCCTCRPCCSGGGIGSSGAPPAKAFASSGAYGGTSTGYAAVA